MAMHGGGYLLSYSGRVDHASGARQDSHADLPLPPTTYLKQVYLGTVVFTHHQPAYLIELFGPDRILMGTGYPFDTAEHNPIGHVAGVRGTRRKHARKNRRRQRSPRTRPRPSVATNQCAGALYPGCSNG
jgi:hypothetical protein